MLPLKKREKKRVGGMKESQKGDENEEETVVSA